MCFSLNFEFFGVFGFKTHPVWFDYEEITLSPFTQCFKSIGVSTGAVKSGTSGF
jgi:hypothetical protein